VITLDRMELFLVRLPLVHEFETSSHRKGHLDHILVRVTDTDGAVGWGESASPSDPYYCGENTETCWLMLRDYFGPALLGKAFQTPDQAAGYLRQFQGNRFARAALDIACWDLSSRRRGISVATALGGTAADVPAGVSLGIEPTIDALLEQVAAHVGQGYRRVKLKIRPGWDVEPTRHVRASFPDIGLQVDANGAYDASRPADDDVFAELDRLGLLMIEQPFEETDLLGHARLQQGLQTPVCLDETITTVGLARAALALQACRVVNIKVSRLGGLGPARQVHDLCRARDVPAWCGGMHEFGVGRAANIALASLPGFTLPSDVSGSDKYFARDVVDPPVRAVAGRVPVPAGRPGLGHEVIWSEVADHVLRTAELAAGR
jgi:O-succinylbenzoate synthase